jgi:hypothetical protein
MARQWPRTPRERFKLAQLMRHTANVISLPAVGETWPDWMTPERRIEMATAFRQWAEIIEPKRPPGNNPPHS